MTNNGLELYTKKAVSKDEQVEKPAYDLLTFSFLSFTVVIRFQMVSSWWTMGFLLKTIRTTTHLYQRQSGMKRTFSYKTKRDYLTKFRCFGN